MKNLSVVKLFDCITFRLIALPALAALLARIVEAQTPFYQMLMQPGLWLRRLSISFRYRITHRAAPMLSRRTFDHSEART